MLIDVLENLEPLAPIESFRIHGVIPYAKEGEMTLGKMKKRKRIADLSFLFDSESFSQISLAWNSQGLCVYVEVDQPLTQVEYPHFSEGDAFELFIDTRNLKESRFFHSFCHRFVFLPKEVRGIKAQELSIFRKGEGHPLCDPKELSIQVQTHKESYEMILYIGSSALYGFDPDTFSQIGLSYRMHRKGGVAQSFCSRTEHFPLEQQPRFWANFSLEK